MQQFNNLYAAVIVGFCVLVFAGCGNPDAKYSKVEGTVTYNGVPVEGATISFAPSSSEGEAAAGLTGPDGKFSVTSSGAVGGGSGVLPGDYSITVSKKESAPPDKDQEAFDRGEIDYNELQKRKATNPYSSGGASKDLLPRKYSLPSSSGLTTTVIKGKNPPLAIELVD